MSLIVEKLHKTWQMMGLYHNWSTALVDRLHLTGQQEIHYNLRNGIEFSVLGRSSDVQIINEIWIDRIYTPTAEFSIGDEWTVVDIGGHKGIFSVYAAASARGVKVFAFEASPQNFQCLCRNISINALKGVSAFNVAVSSQNGEGILYLTDDNGCNSLMHRTDKALRSSVTVPMWSLARVLRTVVSPIDLLKMDIEGVEYAALLSCPSADLSRVERIVLEYHDELAPDGVNSSGLADFLRCEGFEVVLNPQRPILLARRV